MKKIFIFFQLLCQVLLKLKESKISNLNLLLPISTQTNVSYVVQAFNGCYKWISSNPEVLSISALQNKETCQNQITVKVETNIPYHNMIWITAKDSNTGRVLSCEVRLATIKKLEILTKQKTVLVGDYETLELLGYDSKGNVFSTLEGLKFNWNIQQDQNYAEYQTFREANKKTTHKRHQLEEIGQQSDIIILKGHQTGQIEVSAFINDKIHDNTSTSQQLEIIEHFVVIPQNDLFLLPCDQIQFKLFLLHNNNQDIEIDRVVLPDSNFQWKLEGDNIGQLGSDGNLFVGQQLGDSNIIIKDLRNQDNQIQSSIKVVQPWRIKIFVTEYNKEMKNFLDDHKNKVLNPIEYFLSQFDNNWNLLKGKKYIFKAYIMDKNENLVTIQNYKIHFQYSTSHFYNHHEENDSIILEAMSIGDAKLSAKMESHNCLHTFKETHKNLNIFSQIRIFKYIQGPIYLPYFKEQNSNQMYQLQAIGGSGKYDWVVKNQDIATISNHDQLKSHKVGKTKVIVRDMLNPNNIDNFELVVSELKTQEFFEPKVEMLLNQQKDIFITAFDKQKHIYANCTDYQINMNPDQNFEIDKTYNYKKMMSQIQNYLNKYQLMLPQLVSFDFIQPSEYKEYVQSKVITEQQLQKLYKFYQNFGICQNFKVRPLNNKPNHLSFRSFDNKVKQLPLKIYKESSVEYPQGFDKDLYGDKVLLAPGSSATFFIKDGNESWLEDIPINSRVLKKGDDFYDVKIGNRVNGLLPVTIKCKNLDQSLQKEGKFSVITSNKNDQQLYSPLEVISNIEFLCAIPQSMKIIPQEKKNQNPKTFLQNIQNKVILKNNHQHEIITQMFDKEHIPFYNSTSIDLNWELNGYNNGQLQKTSEQNKVILDLNDKIGDLELKVQTSGGANNLKFKPVKDQILIQSKKLLNIEPSFQVLYNHPDNHMDFKIQNGSGDFKISVNNETLVDYEYLHQQRMIRLKPKKQGEVLLKVLDNNLTFQNIAEAKIQIVNIEDIKIQLPQQIVLKGESVPINFELLNNNIKIPKDQIKFMDLTIQTEGDDIEIDNDNFRIQANQEGTYPITIKSNRDGTVSNSIDFQAFDHIHSFPNKLYLIQGCTGYFQIQGGPNKSIRKQEGYEIQVINPNKNFMITQISEDLYEIKANKPLQESIKINLISKKAHKEISTFILNIYIGKVEDLTIRSSNVIHKGATTRLYAIPQVDYNNISISKCKLNYTIRNHSEGALSLNGISNIDRQMNDLKQSILSIEVKGIKKGEGLIDIELDIDGQKSIKRQYYIQVEDSYYLPTSGFIGDDSCTGSFLLLKPNSLYQLPKESSIQSQYQIVQHDGVTELVNRNQIQTFSKLGNDFLIKKYSNQSQNELSIKVQNPYVLIIEESKHLTFMNNLSRTVVDLTYLDSFGRKFYRGIKQEKISVIVSNPDVLSAFVDNVNQRLIIDTNTIGSSLIYIQDENQQQLFDLFQVSVGSLIEPEGTINILRGSTIRFKNLKKDQKNRWKSTNPEVLKIDTSGHAVAVSEGKAQVTFDEKLFLSQTINVQKIVSLKPIEENPRLITNIKNHQDHQAYYQFYFQAYNQEGKLELTSNDLIQLYKVIECKVDSNMFSAQKITDQIDKGLFGCQITMFNNNDRLITNLQISIFIFTDQNQISLTNYTENVNVLQSFITNKSQKLDLKFNKKNNKTKLFFNTNHKLDVELNQQLQPYLTTKFDPARKKQGIQIIIPDTVKDSFKSSFTVKSPLTHESITYKVIYDHRVSFFNFLNLTNKNFGFMDLLIMICCAVIFFMFCFGNCFNKKQNKIQQVNNSTTYFGNGYNQVHLNKTMNNSFLNTGVNQRDLKNRSTFSHNYGLNYQLNQNIKLNYELSQQKILRYLKRSRVITKEYNKLSRVYRLQGKKLLDRLKCFMKYLLLNQE